MKVSVIIAIYNGRKYIEQQLDSILYQTVKPDEIIIVDDNSTQKSRDIINRYMRENKDIYFFENNKNLGVVQTFRMAASKASGDIIFLADQDDIWEKNKISRFIEVFDTKNTHLVASEYRLIDGNGDKIKKINIKTKRSQYVPFKKIVKGNIFPGCTMAFNKNIKAHFLELSADCYIHDWYIAIIAAQDRKFYYINDRLTNYRIHDNNTIGLNRSLSPMYSKNERIENLYNRIKLLKTISNRIKNKKAHEMINKIILFNEKRIYYLTNMKLCLYFLYGLKNIFKYPNIRSFIGDVYIIAKEKLYD